MLINMTHGSLIVCSACEKKPKQLGSLHRPGRRTRRGHVSPSYPEVVGPLPPGLRSQSPPHFRHDARARRLACPLQIDAAPEPRLYLNSYYYSGCAGWLTSAGSSEAAGTGSINSGGFLSAAHLLQSTF